MHRVLRSMFIWAAAIAIPTTAGLAQSSRDHTISGKLLFDQQIACERVRVDLEATENQPVETTYADPACNFRFLHATSQTYVIHVDVDGYEEVRQRIVGIEGVSNMIQMIPARTKMVRRGRTPAVADITELMDQYPRKAVNLYTKAAENHKNGKNDQAIAQLEEAIKLAPNFYLAHNALGLMYRDAGRLDDAEEHFVRAHQINSHSADPLINLSGLYLQEDKAERALEVSQEAVAVNGRSAPALFNLGLALYKVSRLDKAEVALNRALELAPKMFQIHLALANVYLKLKRFDNLLDQLNTYLEQNPNGEDREQVQRLRDQVLNAKNSGSF